MSVILIPEDLGKFIPRNDPSIISYSSEEIAIFRDTVCDQVGLHTLKKVLDKDCNPESLRDLIATIAMVNTYEKGEYKINPTGGSAKFHQKLYRIMYELPLEDMPLYINDEKEYIPAVKWRLSISK